jgi:hypothetical protein
MTKARTLADNFAADINGITAGTGITGGGTSGTVTVTNSMATAIDAKGDLVVGTGADTFSRLAVASTAGYLLSVDSGETTGLKWSAPASGGKVLQVVTGTTTTFTTNATTTYTDTTLTATITPTLASSTILVLVNQNGIATEDGNVNSGVGLRLMRASTEISLIATRATINFTTTGQFGTTLSTAYKDSPATTSATTYKTQFKNNVAANAAYVQIDDAMSTITLLEIGA